METHVITIERIPTSIDELKDLSAASISTPFEAAALAVAVFCNYEDNSRRTIEMINYLKGPDALSPYDIQYIRDHLLGKGYIVRSYIRGTNRDNNYMLPYYPPYEVEVSDNNYSYRIKGYATVYLKSTGADDLRPITLREKDGKWFLWHNTFLDDVAPPLHTNIWY